MEPLEIAVDLQNLDLDDLLLMDKMAKGEASLMELHGFLDRAVVGGIQGKGYKLAQLQEITNAVIAAINPGGDAQGNSNGG